MSLAAQNDYIVLPGQFHRPANGRDAAFDDLIRRFGILHPGKNLPEDLIGVFRPGII